MIKGDIDALGSWLGVYFKSFLDSISIKLDIISWSFLEFDLVLHFISLLAT